MPLPFVRAIFVCLILSGTSTASAQSTTDIPAERPKWLRFGLMVGAGVRTGIAEDRGSATLHRLAPIWRFTRGRAHGLVPAFRMAFFPRRTAIGVSMDARTGGQVLAMRPVMVGAGWWQPIGDRLSLNVSSVAGYSFNTILRDERELSPRLIVDTPVSRIRGSVAMEASARLWTELNSRLSLVTGASWLRARPEIHLADSSIRRWNAGELRLEVGIALTILPAPAPPRQ